MEGAPGEEEDFQEVDGIGEVHIPVIVRVLGLRAAALLPEEEAPEDRHGIAQVDRPVLVGVSGGEPPPALPLQRNDDLGNERVVGLDA